MSNGISPQLLPMPRNPEEYDHNFENRRNRQIDTNLMLLSAVRALMGTTLSLSRIPTSSTDLRSGDVWADPANDYTLKIIP